MRGLLAPACFVLLAGSCFSAPQEEGEATTSAAPTTTPASTDTKTTSEHADVIIKQINEINEDGSYTVGYEAADGTFKMETRDIEGNVEGVYGFLDEAGEIITVKYSSNNSTGFTTDNKLPEQIVTEVVEDPAFAREKARHEAVLAHQKSVVEEQQRIQEEQNLAVQRQAFANQNRGQRRPVFNAANFNPQQSLSSQFDQNSFNQDFNNFQQQQQQQFAPQPVTPVPIGQLTAEQIALEGF